MDFQGWDDAGWFEFFTRVTLPPLWIADQVRNDVSSCPAGGFWMESRNDGMFAKVTYMGCRD